MTGHPHPAQDAVLDRLVLPFADMVEWIEVPPRLTGGEFRLRPNADDEALIGAAWDSAVAAVQRSYADALRLRDEVAARSEATDQARLEQAGEQAFIYILSELKARTEEHGPDTVVSKAPPPHKLLGSFSPPGWTVTYTGVNVDSEFNAERWEPFMYGYHLPEWVEVELRNNGGGSLPHRFMTALHVDAGSTWGQSYELALLSAKAWHSERERRAELRDVLKFRLAILRNVIWQYEAYGLLRQWKEINPVEQEALTTPPESVPELAAAKNDRAIWERLAPFASEAHATSTERGNAELARRMWALIDLNHDAREFCEDKGIDLDYLLGLSSSRWSEIMNHAFAYRRKA